MVSLDFVDRLGKVENSLARKNISPKVWLLDETDANAYIDLVDSRWSGAIPMMLIIDNAGKGTFLEKELTKDELEMFINLSRK